MAPKATIFATHVRRQKRTNPPGLPRSADFPPRSILVTPAAPELGLHARAHHRQNLINGEALLSGERRIFARGAACRWQCAGPANGSDTPVRLLELLGWHPVLLTAWKWRSAREDQRLGRLGPI